VGNVILDKKYRQIVALKSHFIKFSDQRALASTNLKPAK